MQTKHQAMVDHINGLSDFNHHNGIKMVEIRENYAECRIELTPSSLNGQGIAHGAILFALADVAAGIAAGNGRPCVTADASMSFLRPGRGSCLRGVGTPLKTGGRLSTFEGSVYDENDVLVAKGIFTYCYVD